MPEPKALPLDARMEELFWLRAGARPPEGCWLWQGTRGVRGYGVMWRQNQAFKAHRISWAIHHGEIPHGNLVLHRCDVTSCIHPEHLFLGTNADNTHDMISKGRARLTISARGQEHGFARLVEDEVREIRRRAALGEPHAALSREFGIGQSSISRIVSRKRWSHVP